MYWKVIFILLIIVTAGCTSLPEKEPVPERTKASVFWVKESPYITEIVMESGSAPLSIYASDKVWVGEDGFTRISSYDPQTGKFERFELPPNKKSEFGALWDITEYDNHIYYALALFSEDGDVIGKINKETGQVEEFRMSNESSPIQIASGDGVWFTQIYTDKIGVVKDDVLEEIEIPKENSGAAGIFIENDNVWFSESFPGSVSRYNTLTGEFRTFETPFFSPVGIVIHDNKIWGADHGSSGFGFVDIETSESRKYTTSASFFYPTSLPDDLELYDGEFWFTEHTGNRIGRFNPETETLIEYVIPTNGSRLAETQWLSIGPDGKVWFAQWKEDEIGFVDPDVPVPYTLELEADTLEVVSGQMGELGVMTTGADSFDFAFSSSHANTGNVFPMDLFYEDGKVKIRTLTADKGEYLMRVGIGTGPVIVSKYFTLRII